MRRRSHLRIGRIAGDIADDLQKTSFHADAGVTAAADANDYMNYDRIAGARHCAPDENGAAMAALFVTCASAPVIPGAGLLVM